MTHWGSKRGRRVFDILIDGTKLAAETLLNHRPGQFDDQVYPLAEELTKGKNQLTVTFQAHQQSTAGGVFGVRILTVK